MQVVISCHLDTVFKDPFSEVKDGIQTGSCDNVSGVLACAQLIKFPEINIQFTHSEEDGMGGARWVAAHFSPETTFLVVVDCIERAPRWKSINFTVENFSNVDPVHIKRALKSFARHYVLREYGSESEAWLYREKGFSCLEVDIPVTGGLHNLTNRARVGDILAAADAMKAIVDYFSQKSRSEILPPGYNECCLQSGEKEIGV